MTINSLISTELAYRLGWTLMHSLWEGTAIALIFGLILAGLPTRLSWVRYLGNLAAICLIAASAVVTFAVSHAPELPMATSSSDVVASSIVAMPPISTPVAAMPAIIPISVPQDSGIRLPSNTRSPSSVNSPSSIAPMLGTFSKSIPSSPAAAEKPLSIWARLQNQLPGLFPSAAILWLAGVLLLAFWRIGGWISTQRLRVLKTEPIDARIMQMVKRLTERLRLSKPCDVLLSHLAQTPMVIGWLRPVILIPVVVATGLPPSQLEAILAHELAHIRRGDFAINLFVVLLETLMFYHPAVWWLSRRMRLEREQACDDIALSVCSDRYIYADSLVALEELRLRIWPALGASGSGGREMVTRIRRILAPADDAHRLGLPSAVLVILLTGLSIAFYGQTAKSQTTPVQLAATSSSRPTTSPQTPNNIGPTIISERRLPQSDIWQTITTRPHYDIELLQGGPNSSEFHANDEFPKLSPFTAVRWHGDFAEVQYKDTWYQLVSINDLSVADIMASLKDDFAPQKHFAEDLVEVLTRMGHKPGNTVKLDLKTLDTGKDVTIADAEMNEANRLAVWQFGNNLQLAQAQVVNDGAATQPADVAGTVTKTFPLKGQDATVIANALNRVNAAMQARDPSWTGTVRADAATNSLIFNGSQNFVDQMGALIDRLNGNLPLVNPRNRPPIGLSPFTAIRWHDLTPEVRFDDTWYEFIAINDLPTADIINFMGENADGSMQKHFAEDMVSVMSRMGQKPTDHVKLTLKTLDTKTEKVFDNALMTEENRWRLWGMNPGEQPTSTRTFFTSVKWDGNTAEVEVAGTSYDLVGIDDHSAQEIFDFAAKAYGDTWRQKFADDALQILHAMGDQPIMAQLQLKTLDTKEDVSVYRNVLTVPGTSPAMQPPASPKTDSSPQTDATKKILDDALAQIQAAKDEAQKQHEADRAAMIDLINKTDEKLKQYDLQHEQDLAMINTLIKERNEALIRLDGKRIQPETKPSIFDGKIVNRGTENVVYIDLGDSDGVKEGMQFVVYPAKTDAHNPDANQLINSLGSIVVEKVFPNSSQCQVVVLTPGRHIDVGDLLIGPVPIHNRKFQYFVFGDFDLAHTGKPSAIDRTALKAIIKEHGGEVQDEMNDKTDFVVMGLEPQVKPLSDESKADPFLVKQQEDMEQARKDYDAVISKARELHIPLMNQNRFIYYIGLGNWLPPATQPSSRPGDANVN